jgi:tetratricopeptide (TPR) repeat protein
MNTSIALQVPQWFQEGLRLHQGGRLAEAEACYRRVLAADRRHFDALHLLGVCRHQLGDFSEAEKHLRAALKVRPEVAAVHLNYGNVLREQGNLAAALESYRRATRLDATLAPAHYNQGTALEEMGQHAEALSCYERALQLQVDAAALVGRGNCLQALGRDDEAIADYRAAGARDPRHVDAQANLAAVWVKQRRHAEALGAAERALALDALHPGANLNRVIALNELGRAAEALVAVERVLAAVPPTLEVQFQRGRTLARLQRAEEALTLFDQVLAAEPAHWGARLERAGALGALGRITESEQLFEQMLSERPDDPEAMMQRGLLVLFQGDTQRARRDMERALALRADLPLGQYNLAFVDLVEGRFEDGWRRYEQRWDEPAMRPHLRRYAQPLWLGAPDIAGKAIFVHAEQGCGDTIQFCRYIPLLQARGARVIFEVPGPLFTLMRRCLPDAVRVVPPGVPLPPFDFHCPLMSLPLAFGTALATIPAPLAYLRADPQRLELWRNRLGDAVGPRIGLAWSGNARHARDRERSIMLASLLPWLQAVAAAPGGNTVSFLGLQNDLRPEDRAVLAQAPALQYFGEAIEDFDDTAALIGLCDSVVCVDTAPIHLAGALGKPAWLLAAHMPDWRWLLQRSDSPWYPSIRVVRQRQRGEWSADLDALAPEVLAALRLSHPGAAAAGGADPAPAGAHTQASPA